VRLLTRRGYDWTQRIRLIVDAVAGLRCRSCMIDGEAVACDDQGTPDLKLLIRNRLYASAQLYAFDLLELDGEDLRGEPIERRKEALNKLLRKDRAGLLTSQPIEARLMSPSNTFASSGWRASCRRSSVLARSGSRRSIQMRRHFKGWSKRAGGDGVPMCVQNKTPDTIRP
jgi:bifunctional non-homologous end joining protein LigD